MILEATAVTPEGRISPQDLGLCSDANEAALAEIVRMVRSLPPIALAVQLSHAGRKGSSRAPWHGGTQIPAAGQDGWRAVAPSALPHAATEEPPAALDADGLVHVKQGFVDAAVRAQRAGLQGIELHAAHGYLLHQFLSPLANTRDDIYGGSLDNRMRFPLEVFDAVRRAVSLPVWVRVSATDWVTGGWDLPQTLALGDALAQRGCAALHVSSGGISPAQQIPIGPGYQLPLARAVRDAVKLPVIGVGLITEPAQAEAAIANGDADAVALARAMLYNPRWPWHAAACLGAQVQAPAPYWRSAPREAGKLFSGMQFGQR